MNLLGKGLTVAILIFSVAFLIIAMTVFATHRNWRDAVMLSREEASNLGKPVGLKHQLEDLSATNRNLRAEIERASDRLAVEQAARRFALASAQAREAQMSQQLDDQVREYERLLTENGELTETLNTNQTNLATLTKEVEGLRGEIREAQQARDEKFRTVVALTEQMNAVEGERQKLEERQLQLSAQLGRMKNVLDRNELTEFTPVDDKAPPVDGIVMAVGEADLIEISIGSDDGLRKGHTLEVFRNNSYLGRIVVQHTEPDRSVGKILREYRKGIIKKGDRVATKLS